MRASNAIRVVVCLYLDGLVICPFTMWTENRYDAGEACLFVGDLGVGGDFAVVRMNGTGSAMH